MERSMSEYSGFPAVIQKMCCSSALSDRVRQWPATSPLKGFPQCKTALGLPPEVEISELKSRAAAS